MRILDTLGLETFAGLTGLVSIRKLLLDILSMLYTAEIVSDAVKNTTKYVHIFLPILDRPFPCQVLNTLSQLIIPNAGDAVPWKLCLSRRSIACSGNCQ